MCDLKKLGTILQCLNTALKDISVSDLSFDKIKSAIRIPNSKIEWEINSENKVSNINCDTDRGRRRARLRAIESARLSPVSGQARAAPKRDGQPEKSQTREHFSHKFAQRRQRRRQFCRAF